VNNRARHGFDLETTGGPGSTWELSSPRLGFSEGEKGER
jgi:hypothetical protein